jgi:hypothetical protein
MYKSTHSRQEIDVSSQLQDPTALLPVSIGHESGCASELVSSWWRREISWHMINVKT